MKKTIFCIVAILALALACAPTSQPTPVPTPVPTIKPDLATIARDYPKVDGSTSTQPLHVVVACKAFGVRCAWQESLFSEKTMGPDLMQSVRAEAGKVFDATRHTGTNPAYVNLIQGKADLILVARAPSEDELKLAKEHRVELDARAFALDAFVILVNVQNPLDDLKIENVRDVYTGKITNWATFGGKGQIKAYQRGRNSGSQELMEALVMKGAPMIKAPEMIIETMMGAVNAIGRDPLGIGYSVYYYVTFMLPDKNVKLVGVNGVKPTSDNIATRAYPLTAEVYAVTRKNMPRESTATMLRDWLFTDEGRATIVTSGYVPLTSK
ncbi:MAG: substrate-binding domain-containing protein [Anaerolineales bacterium]|nr:substrate-binding domain-containing protein [Anaerolineales bacterium]